MHESQRYPLSLKIVAFLFMICGIFSAMEVFIALMRGRISFNIGVLGLFIGWGLLQLNRGWRTCALVFLWIGMMGYAFAAMAFLFGGDGAMFIDLFGVKIEDAPMELGLAVATIGFVIAFWPYRVLTRPGIRDLFGVPAK